MLYIFCEQERPNQNGHLSSPISIFAVPCLDKIIPNISKSKVSSLELFSPAEQTGLCLTWLETLKTGFRQFFS